MLSGLLLVTPLAPMQAMPSPAGASVAVACLVGLIVPVAVAAGCARSDSWLESVGTRPTRLFDYLLLMGAVAGVAGLALLEQSVGFAAIGRVFARAGLAYAGLLLIGRALGAWRLAALLPASYLTLVAVAGRGNDVLHPAWWAWIASDAGDTSSWLLTTSCVGLGTVLYWRRSSPLTIADVA
ncbi:MAG: hypothetical protein ACREMY_17600 [bacterium]